MPLFDWNEKLTLGIEQFDTPHQHMVGLLNRAHDNFVADSSVEALASSLDEFFDYAIKHFHFEEQFMEENHYAGYAEHLELKRSFSAQVVIMRKDLKSWRGSLPLAMLTFLKNWLTYNILFADANYVRTATWTPWKNCA